jgi:hypothetical protein
VPPTDRRPPATSAIRASGVSNSPPSLSPRVLSPGVHDLSTCVLLDLTATIHFDSSGFGVSNSYALVPPRVLSPEDNGFPPRIPLDLTAQIHFGSFRVLSPKVHRSLAMCPSRSDGPDSLRLFRVREFQTPAHSFLRSAFTRRLRSVDTYPPGDQRTRIYFVPSTISPSPCLQALKCFRSRVVDLAPPVPLDDEWSLITSGLGTLASLLSCAHKGIKALCTLP